MTFDDLTPICPYCKGWSVQVFGDAIYPHLPDLFDRKFYLCRACDAYVGTHKKSGKPLGTLAGPMLRSMRKDLHEAFDPLWENGIFESRTQAYAWLAKAMDIDPKFAHIGQFNEDQCFRAMQLIEVYYG
ncbi:MAG: DUF3268 family zinc-finger domain-containing protein [Actinobacteria bacterium]|nr:DUF3268 family zinc-finger domain-containing protein [Actinomycetota bacterium]MCA1807127.1 DUF3268 family zinc-finger domain-containing protein [Actinomycetota bacterium]